jgi:hypothetical protein
MILVPMVLFQNSCSTRTREPVILWSRGIQTASLQLECDTAEVGTWR